MRRPDGLLEHLCGILAALFVVPMVALAFLFCLPALFLRPAPAGKSHLPIRMPGKSREGALRSERSADNTHNPSYWG